VISHLPLLCEESDVPYVYVPSKEDLGSSGSTKRPTSCIMIPMPSKSDDKEYKELVEEAFKEIRELNEKTLLA
jgi:H/ACA ribonucleoprotein complex subunit 2